MAENEKVAENEKGEKTPNCKSLLVKYFKETSLYGFPRLFKAKLIGLKIFWVIWILICLLVVVYVLASRITYYLSYPREMKTSIESVSVTRIPALTICDMGWDVRQNSYSTNESLLKYPDYHQKIIEHKHRTESLGVTHINDEDWKYISDHGYYESIGLDAVKLLSKPKDQFALKCKFVDFLSATTEEHACEEKYHVQQNVQRLDQPNCYTYTPKDGVQLSASTMSLILHVGPGGHYSSAYSAQEMDDMREKVAAKVIFHDRMDSPDMRYGHMISPGNFYRFDVELTEHKGLPPPYGACESSEHDEVHSKSECERQHKMDAVLDECNCLTGDVVPTSQQIIQNNKFCGYLYEDDFEKTLTSVNCNRDILTSRGIHCMQKCERYIYSGRQTASTNWPNGAGKIGLYNSVIKSSVYENQFMVEYEDIKQKINASNNVTEIDLLLQAEMKINEQFLRLDINMDSLTEVKVMEEHVLFTISDMLNGWCIVLYFFCGFTAYTIAEIIEVIVLGLCRKKVV